MENLPKFEDYGNVTYDTSIDEQETAFRYHWRCAELSLFQLGFADDLLLFCEAHDPSIAVFQRGLELFAILSGLHLIKSVLMALNTYWEMAFILPKGIIKEIKKGLRNFLWKGVAGTGYWKVAWSQVCNLVDEEGLGVRDI
ncbi:UNVERIFIED_CONTAM: hypothetical protein Scaly_2205500 [Sesamum calycinum]|uniref:Uncharacterized protein n=1 Tax=Sesamum calycinum TaxID=2727403 RepID=A0AAW2MQJ2_9LAMI